MRSLYSITLCAFVGALAVFSGSVAAQSVTANVYYVRVFDGFMPIPSRYGVDAAPVRDRPAVRFISPVLFPDPTPGANTQKTVGYIESGRRAKDEPAPFSHDSDVNIISHTSDKSLEIILFDYKNVDGITGAYLYTDKEFMLVVDEDATLWRRMLDDFVKVSE